MFDLHGDIGSAQFIKGKMAVEGQNIFGQASQTGIQIIFLIYQPKKSTKNSIQYLSINQLLTNLKKSTKNKLLALKKYTDINQLQDLKNLYQKMQHTSCNQEQK